MNAHKFTQHKDFFNLFSLDSGSKASMDTKMAAAMGSKARTYKGKVVRDSKIKVDEDYDERAPSLLQKAYAAKFEKRDDNEFYNILRKTKQAKLMVYCKGREALEASQLMKYRNSL